MAGTTMKLTKSRKAKKSDYFAQHDSTTGLPKRNLLEKFATNAILTAKQNATEVGLLFINIDDFKRVNDAFNYATGDQLLQLVGDRLKQVAGAVDLVGQLAGDQFLMVFTGFQKSTALLSMVEKIKQVFTLPFRLALHGLYLTVSIGISLYPEDGLEVSELMAHADIALQS